jgi:D-inositol-3-phosphate glycosyltransferase
MEMMAAGLPIVAARLPSVQEIVKDGEHVLMAGAEEHDEWSAAIRRLMEEPELAARLAASAKSKSSEFTYDRRAASMLVAMNEAFRT